MKNYTPVYVYPLKQNDGWRKLTGELPVKMTNDYLFRALLQSDNDTLKALLASLLHMDVKMIRSAKVTNPILLGEAITDKTFIMDIKVELNNDSLINLEMQVIREEGWTNRSLSYTCRMYDQLNRGKVYAEAKPVRQIAFCDFTLFDEYPEFYATYKLINEKNARCVYTEKFIISNVNLKRIDLADEDDKKYGLDRWCRLVKAETWEDMKMIAEKDTVISKAISGVWQLTEEERIREQCRAREEWLINDQWKNDKIARQNETIGQQRQQLAEKDAVIAEKDSMLSEKDSMIADKDREIEELKRQLENRSKE